MNKTAADVEREVEASRSDLDRTVEALKDKMTPGQIFDEASRAMGGAGQQVLAKFLDQAKENPMPLAVMGLGLAWLMTSSNKKPASSAYGLSGEPRSFAPDGSHGGLGDKVHSLTDGASDLISDAKDKLASAGSAAGDRARAAVHDLNAEAGSIADKAGQYGQQAGSSLVRLFESEPLLIGAVGLIVGAAIGAALPSTDVEDRAVGPVRDKLLEKGKDIAQDGLQQAGHVAQAAYESVKDELAHPSGGDSPAERAQAVARVAVHAGEDALGAGGQQSPQ